jgi:hypothetical protein
MLPSGARAVPRPEGTGFASLSGMNDNKTPHNQDGQQPTHSAKETEERLEEKENEDHGQANKDRIEAKISTLKD